MQHKNCPQDCKKQSTRKFEQVLAKNYGVYKKDSQAVYVDAKNGSDECNDGTLQSPVKTVNAAILLTAANGFTTVYLAEGHYILSKQANSHIRFIGASKEFYPCLAEIKALDEPQLPGVYRYEILMDKSLVGFGIMGEGLAIDGNFAIKEGNIFVSEIELDTNKKYAILQNTATLEIRDQHTFHNYEFNNLNVVRNSVEKNGNVIINNSNIEYGIYYKSRKTTTAVYLSNFTKFSNKLASKQENYCLENVAFNTPWFIESINNIDIDIVQADKFELVNAKGQINFFYSVDELILSRTSFILGHIFAPTFNFVSSTINGVGNWTSFIYAEVPPGYLPILTLACNINLDTESRIITENPQGRHWHDSYSNITFLDNSSLTINGTVEEVYQVRLTGSKVNGKVNLHVNGSQQISRYLNLRQAASLALADGSFEKLVNGPKAILFEDTNRNSEIPQVNNAVFSTTVTDFNKLGSLSQVAHTIEF